MVHVVKLSNGQELLIEEGVNSLSFASVARGEADYWICQFNPDGVLVYTSAGGAASDVAHGLKGVAK